MGMKIAYLAFVISFLLGVLIIPGFVLGIESGNYITDVVVSSGGGNTSSSNYLNEIISGIISGNVISSAGYKNYIGFYVDIIFPKISIDYPANSTRFSDNPVNVTYTVSDVGGLDSCWYSNDTMISNTTFASCDTNLTTINWTEGQHNVTIWVNDTANNINSSIVTFFLAYCGDAVCDFGENCTSCMGDCGLCGTGGGGGGGGSAPSTMSIRGEDVFIGNKFIDVYMGLDSIKTNKINLYNQANEIFNIRINVNGLNNILTIKEEDLSFLLLGNEKRTINVRIISPAEPGVYEGNIKITSKRSVQTIEVKITVTDQELWFDAEVAIPWDYKIIGEGSSLPVQLNLLPVGLEQGFDVEAIYTIKDFDGRLWLDESKMFFVNDSYTEKIDFATGNLPDGQYVLELELIYPGGVATSRSSFEVRGAVEGLLPLTSNRLIYLIFGMGILVLIIASILVIRSYKKIRKHKK
jgi:hypothetical protein